MERDVTNKDEFSLNDSDERPRSAVNAAVLDYYKKFGRKRDLEQYFSLSTAQSEIRDPRSLFWRRMKEQSDTSDSGEKKSESSNEICRVSIQCSIAQSDPQKENSSLKSDSESPPIITDVVPGPSGDESVDDNHSQKSIDVTLDTSINKPVSPTSSITSQRKLEWDSLADVGYGNESDRKTSASSLSTLEREVLAQKQQYTLDFKQNSDLGQPTAHSTPVDPNDNKPKHKKGQGKKTSFSKKDIDILEVTVPHHVENSQAINVNLTKQFSVSLGTDGGITVNTGKKDVSVTPETKNEDPEISTAVKLDKEIQTTLLRSKEKAQSSGDCAETVNTSQPNVPVYICLNTVKNRHKRKKVRTVRSKNLNRRKCYVNKETLPDKEKSGEQVSEAESFEYMPGHIYNQNQLNENSNMPINNNAGNKSSLESSAVHTTDSSKESKCSFTKELNKSLDVLKLALKDKYDSNLKKKLVKEVIQRLLKSNYRDDESTPEFLSVLSLHSKKTPTTSTSEADNTGENMLHSKPKKSILRSNKFNSNDIASTSQSAPNLPSVINSENPVLSYLPKQILSTTTDTDNTTANNSAKDISSSDTIFVKTSSEELLKKYIDALKKEEAYKQHLKDKHLFLRQKLVRSESGLKIPVPLDIKTNKKLKDLIKDLTRNNYDDGSGDASKLEGGSSSNFDFGNGNRVARKQRNHSVFTLSAGNSNRQSQSGYPRRNEQKGIAASSRAGPSQCIDCNESIKKHAYIQSNVTDSSVQVNLTCNDQETPYATKAIAQPLRTIASIPTALTEDIKYVCLCTEKSLASQHGPDEFLIYKCSKLPGNMTSQGSNTVYVPCVTKCTSPYLNTAGSTENKSNLKLEDTRSITDLPLLRKMSKSSQTNCVSSNTPNKLRARSTISSSSDQEVIIDGNTKTLKPKSDKRNKFIQESTRCLQTEISIHPKISDPALSDVNIINSAECVKLINELYRKISRSSSERNVCQRSSETDEVNPCTCSKTSKDNNSHWDKQSQDNLSADERDIAPINQPIECNCHLTPQPESNSDKIVIPIDGTSMTLKVSIAGKSPPSLSNPIKDQIQKETLCYVESVNKEMTTKKIEGIENFTCISAECSKAVQSENIPDIFRNDQCYPNEGKPVEEVLRLNTCKFKIGAPYHCYPNEEQPVEAFQSNTYPKTMQTNVRKPLIRHNTDICINTEIGSSIPFYCGNDENRNNSDKETEHVMKKLVMTNKSRPKNNSELPSSKTIETSSDHSISDNAQPDSLRLNKSSKFFTRTSKSSQSNMIKKDGTTNDMILDMIQDITKRYTKKDPEKSNKKKCYEEILKVLDYLLDTDDSGEGESELLKDSQSSNGNKSPKEQQVSSGTNKSFYKEYALQYLNTNNNLQNISQAVNHDSTKISKNNDTKQESAKHKTCKNDKGSSVYKKQDTDRQTCPETCDVACGCDTCDKQEYKDGPDRDDQKYKTGISKLTLKSIHQETEASDKSECKDRSDRDDQKCKTDISKLTLKSIHQETEASDKSECKDRSDRDDQKCKTDISKLTLKSLHKESEASDKPECKDRSDRDDQKCKTDISKLTLKSIHQETEASDMQSSEISKPKMKCTELKKLHSVCKNLEPPQEGCPEKCDVACGCDEPGCKDRSEHDKPTSRSMRPETGGSDTQSLESSKRESSEQLCPQFCDIGCGCDEPVCRDRYQRPGHDDSLESKSEHGAEKHKTSIAKVHQKTNESSSKTCDKCCGRDDSLESKDSSSCDCMKYIINRCDHKCFGCKNHNLTDKCSRNLVSKCVQSTARKVKLMCSPRHSSQCQVLSDQQSNCTDSPTAKIIHKIKKECEKYQKRSKAHCNKINEATSSTSTNCDHCNRANWHCSCRGQKCRGHRTRTTMEKIKKKCVAYNLVLQTSDSVGSEEQTDYDRHCRPLQNIILKVPKQKQEYVPFKELSAKIEQNFSCGSHRCSHKNRSRSWPHDGGISSTDDVKMAQVRTVRDYLEKNRPDFVERCTDRQNCIRTLSRSRPEGCSRDSPRMKMIVVHNPNCSGCTGPTTMYCGGVPMNFNCTDPCLQTVENEVTTFDASSFRASEHSKQIQMLSMQLGGLQTQSLTNEEMLHLAKEIGLGHRRTQPKFISEREMKKHSERIYKTLPEVKRMKEEARKEAIKRTNLLMASLFKKNLQKKTLRGAVNLSNYSAIIK